MSDIVTTIKEAVCLPDTGCMSVVTCICDILQDAADEIERLRNMVDQCDHHEHSLQEAHAETERLRTCVKTLTGQLQYIGDIATATAEDAKRWKETK